MKNPSLLTPRRLATGGALLLVAALMPLSTMAAPANTKWVNDDKPAVGAAGKDCGKPNYNTIQAAIDGANPGDTIKVCSGTYSGATVNKLVHLDGDHAVINTGPYSHPGLLRAGFLFNGDRSGSGSSIEGFEIDGATQFGADDGMVDFGIFSRGADDVTVRHNDIDLTLQAITSHNGTGWDIEHNKITDLWSRCGGGIGIIVGGNDGVTSVVDNVIDHNDVKGTLFVSPSDCGGYTGVGITLYADFRYGRPGAPTISNNNIDHNKVDLVSDTPAVVDVDGIEITDTRADDNYPAVPGNSIAHNDIKGAPAIGIWSSAGTSGNAFTDNKVKGATDLSCQDQSIGAGTAGTANTWDKDKGDTPSDPAGICD
jgi:hypothetical protein